MTSSLHPTIHSAGRTATLRAFQHRPLVHPPEHTPNAAQRQTAAPTDPFHNWPTHTHPTPELIQNAIHHTYGTTPNQLKSPTKRQPITHHRHIAIYLQRQLTKDSLHTIADHYNRDHSTILHAINQIRQKTQNDPQLKQQIQDLAQRIKQAHQTQ